MYDFISFALFKFTLVTKLINFDFESHRNTLIFFDIYIYIYIYIYIIYIFNSIEIVFFFFQLVNLSSDKNLSCFFLSYLYFLALL